MDLNHLYAMVNELSEVLKNNRDLTSGIIKSAEDIAVCHLLPFLYNKIDANLKLYSVVLQLKEPHQTCKKSMGKSLDH